MERGEIEFLKRELLAEIKDYLAPYFEGPKVQGLYKSSEVRKLLNISAGTLRSLRIQGILNPKKLSARGYRYPAKEVNDLLSKRKS
ncbi:helix-turn-helix domain-containing protein [Pedobacter deserti]|uniref:helix-turn-helix domain-containing protein n=1 Tax=Pedobacter deserti TaxID=2817382 RepID=UPI00210ED28C|nr:helix-turn-helix domain-containing protein [Pedobacter sp. SYSU D00382]